MFRRLVFSLLFCTGLYGAPQRPDFVFVVVDDLRWDELGFAGHPVVQTPHADRLATEGIQFRNAFVTTPLCSPSRASILTGLYPHTHGITDNTDRSEASHRLTTFPALLHRAGYRTAFVGKWHMGNDDTPRPGFDYWVGLKGQGESNDPQLNDNGNRRQVKGYVTDVLTDHAIDFLRRQKPDQNFFLYLAHKAIHPNLVQRADGSLSDPTASFFIPAERHKNLYAGVQIPRRPNAFKSPVGKTALMREILGLPPLGRDTVTSDESILGRWRMLRAIDEGLGRILQTLKDTGRLDNTVIVFTSDNGYFYGEHGLSVERRLAYEESIRVPLVIRAPRLAAPGTKRDQTVLSIDLAPTFLDLAGMQPPQPCHGRSLAPLLRTDVRPWRDAFLIEYFTDKVFPRVVNMGYQAVRTSRHKYIHYKEIPNADELYDLESDPYEMRNRANEASARDLMRRMRGELERLLAETGGRP